MEDLIHSNNENVAELCEDKTSQISEKDNEIANVIQNLKPTECNEMSSRIKESSTKNSIEHAICNVENSYTLEET